MLSEVRLEIFSQKVMVLFVLLNSSKLYTGASISGDGSLPGSSSVQGCNSETVYT